MLQGSLLKALTMSLTPQNFYQIVNSRTVKEKFLNNLDNRRQVEIITSFADDLLTARIVTINFFFLASKLLMDYGCIDKSYEWYVTGSNIAKICWE